MRNIPSATPHHPTAGAPFAPPARAAGLLVLASLLLAAALPADAAAAARNRHVRHIEHVEHFDLSRPEIQSFITEAVGEDALPRAGVVRLLRSAHRQQSILDLVSRPPEQALPWWQYRSGFVSSARVAAGVRFWQAHRATLEQVSQARGVPPEYIVAILGCETFYGRNIGSSRVLDALATLAFDYPPRSDFFRGELRQFMVLAREQRLKPLRIKGSYTGAMGAPQFMPSSYRKYGVDGDQDRRVDLWHDWTDIIASVAYFLQANGWTPGQPVLAEAQVGADSTAKPISRFEFTDTLDSLAAQGVHADSTLPGTTPAMLLAAEHEDGPSFRVGFQNFFVITRYNRSAHYAMAVHDLAEAIAGQMHEPPTGAAGAPSPR